MHTLQRTASNRDPFLPSITARVSDRHQTYAYLWSNSKLTRYFQVKSGYEFVRLLLWLVETVDEGRTYKVEFDDRSLRLIPVAELAAPEDPGEGFQFQGRRQARDRGKEIGRASCRERVCQHV